MEKQQLMLYFHIPFCLSKCAYCAFYSAPCKDEELKEAYKNALIKQINGFESPGDYRVSSIYFGGGTPTVLGADRLGTILETASAVFDVDDSAEITVEANPGTVDYTALCKLKGAGFNRLSLGVQSFNDSTLRLLNRAHSAAEAISCLQAARRAGFYNISADLIFALPNENEDMFAHSLDRLVELRPEHISVYSLGIEEGTPLYDRQDLYRFPTEDEEEGQYALLCQALGVAGYGHYEISNFALPGKEARHNTGYWRRIPYFGFGAAAHSFFQNRRFSAVCDTREFISAVEGGYLAPTDFKDSPTISPEEAEEERIMLGLRLRDGIELDASRIPTYLRDSDLIEVSGPKVAITEKGFRVSNAIIDKLI